MTKFVKRYGCFYKIKDGIKTEISEQEYETGKAAVTPSISIEMPTLDEPAVTENGQDWFDENEE